MSVQHHAPAALPSRNEPGTQGTGDWVCPTAGLDISERRKSPAPAGIRNPDRPDPILQRLRNLQKCQS